MPLPGWGTAIPALSVQPGPGWADTSAMRVHAPLGPPETASGPFLEGDDEADRLRRRERKRAHDAERVLDGWERYRALIDASDEAYELIDMEQQRGHHPRIGAVDTIEVYPAKGISIEECREFAEELGHELFKRHGVPIYFTGKNARRPDREGLTAIRKGNYEGLRESVLTDPSRAPDLGPAKLHPTTR